MSLKIEIAIHSSETETILSTNGTEKFHGYKHVITKIIFWKS